MNPLKTDRGHWWATAAVASVFLWAGCGGDGTGVEEEQTGVTLQGQVVQVGDQASADVIGSMAQESFAPVSDVTVTVGGKSTETDQNGNFSLPDVPLEDFTAVFSGSGITGAYNWTGHDENTVLQMNGVQVNNGQVTTEHTGTWVGTAGSSDPGSQGQIAFTLIIAANGNALSGTGSVAPPDNSIWSMSGIETGTTVVGEMTLVSSNSSCATGATFTGAFSADTLSGTFTEVNPPAGCGSPESGTFTVVKQ